MLINDIIKQVNKLVSNSSSFLLRYDNLKNYINSAVDIINLRLKTNMATPEEEWETKKWIYTISNNDKFLGDYYDMPSITLNDKGYLFCNLADNNYYYFNGLFWCSIDIVNGTYTSNVIVEHNDYLGAFSDFPEKSSLESYPKYFYNTSTKCYYEIESEEHNWELVKYVRQKEFPLDIPQTTLTDANTNYSAMPDNIIRTVLIYYIAALYLEEEDEFEYQYTTYKERAENSLTEVQKIHYSVYTCDW